MDNLEPFKPFTAFATAFVVDGEIIRPPSEFPCQIYKMDGEFFIGDMLDVMWGHIRIPRDAVRKPVDEEIIRLNAFLV